MRLWESNQIMRWKGWWKGFRRDIDKPKQPPVLDRIKALFKREGIAYRLIPHTEVFTAPELAASIHISGKKVAKVVVVRVDKRYVLAVLPSDRQLDLVRLSHLLRARHVSLAKEQEMRTLFPDCEVGAVPPFGVFYGLGVYMDAALAEEEDIFFPAGSRHEVIQMRSVDFNRLVHPEIDSISLEPLKSASGF